MSRTRNASIIATFSYILFGLSFVSGIVMVPFILRHIDIQNYGLWLACVEVLAYSSMVDLGVLGVAQWMIAQKDGCGDRQSVQTLVSNTFWVSLLIGVAYFLVAWILWHFIPGLAGISKFDQQRLFGPISVIVVCNAISYPLRTFAVVLAGLQDVFFSGLTNICLWILNIGLVFFLLVNGYGLYALAVSTAVPTLVISFISLLRVAYIARDLITGWKRPILSEMFHLTGQGLGGWMGAFGWRMIAASNSIVILYVLGPKWVVIYVCTAKLGDILTQMAWQLSDSGLVGLAQLSGEGKPERVKEIVLVMVRLLLVTSGGVALIVLLFNPSFVTLWVGQEKFGGTAVNLFLVASLISNSLVHSLFAISSVLGKRLQIGFITLIQGSFDIVVALSLGYIFGLVGIAASTMLSSLLIAIPLGARILTQNTNLSIGELMRKAIWPWFIRGTSLLIVGAMAGAWLTPKFIWFAIVLVPTLITIYIWNMRPLYVGLPLPLSVKPCLVRIRLITPS